MATIDNRLASLEEHRRNRDKHDDRVLEVMDLIQKDVHTLAMRVEKKISFMSGMAFAFSLLGSGVGASVIYGLKKTGLMA